MTANLVQRGVRAALTHSVKDLTGGAEVVTTALTGIGEQLGGLAAHPALNSTTAAAAALAVAGTAMALKAGYAAMTAHQDASNNAYNLFHEDYRSGSVSFFLPKEPSDRTTNAHHLFASILDFLQDENTGRQSDIFRRAGIHYIDNVQGFVPVKMAGLTVSNKLVRGTQYALISAGALPLIADYEYARGDDPLLDRARHGSAISIRARLPIILDRIYHYSTEDLLEYDALTGHLNQSAIRHLDLVRFIVIAFTNIVINAEHPPDLSNDSDMPLNAKDAMALCDHIKEVLDKFLVPTKNSKIFASLQKLYFYEDIMAYLRMLRREVQELQEGYQSQLLNQLNLTDLIAQSQSTLQSLNATWHQVLFLEEEGKKLFTSNENLLHLVRRLSNALDDQEDFWTSFGTFVNKQKWKFPEITGINKQLSTVVDLIGVFATLSVTERETLLKSLTKKYNEIHAVLHELNQYFILPFADRLAGAGKNPTQAYLLSLITMSIESHPPLLQETLLDTGNPSLEQQFARITHAQIDADTVSDVGWTVFDVLGFKKETKLRITDPSSKTGVIQIQSEFIEALRIVCSVRDLLNDNKNLLLLPETQSMLKRALKTLSDTHKKLMDKIRDLYAYVNQHDHEGTLAERKQYIAHMLSEKKGLEHFAVAIKEQIDATMAVLDAPRFTQNVRQDIVTNLATIYYSHAEFECEKERLLSAAFVKPTVRIQPPRYASMRDHEVLVSTIDVGIQTAPLEPVATKSDVSSTTQSPRTFAVSTQRSAFRLQLICRILGGVSAFLLVAGVLAGLALTLGAPYITIIAALTAQQTASAVVVAAGSAVIGGAGLVLSYLFKPVAPTNALVHHDEVVSCTV